MDTMSVDVPTLRCATSLAGPRARAQDFLRGLRPAIAAEAAETVVLVVSELVTNALHHGGGACTVQLTAHPDSTEVAVHDHRPPPRMRTPDLNDGTGGFGWPTVNRLARTTAVTRRAGGRTGGDEPLDDLAELARGDGREVGAGLQAHGVQQRGPGGAAGLQRRGAHDQAEARRESGECPRSDPVRSLFRPLQINDKLSRAAYGPRAAAWRRRVGARRDRRGAGAARARTPRRR